MKKFICSSTYLLYRATRPLLPKTHLFKQYPVLTLKKWTDHATELTVVLSVMFWLQPFFIGEMLYIIYHGK